MNEEIKARIEEDKKSLEKSLKELTPQEREDFLVTMNKFIKNFIKAMKDLPNEPT